jgi:phospho-N-acetylmuramoyl-pentapeptide-transferase
MIWTVIKILLPITLTFLVGILITPAISGFLYKHKMWKKKSGKKDNDGNKTPIYNKLYKNRDTRAPNMGGLVVWVSVLITLGLLWLFGKFMPIEIFSKLEFVSRNQTWIPAAVFFFGALVGLLDDYLEIKRSKGVPSRVRLGFVGLVGILVSTWFFEKLDVASIGIPFVGEVGVGWLLIPIFTIIMLVMYTGSVIDGLDGLSGGVLAIVFSAYGLIAFMYGQIDLAAFSASIAGGLLAFLWFNIPPARFYMSETGMMPLIMTLSVIAFMTDSLVGGYGLFVLPIIAITIIISGFSSVGQIYYKKLTGGKKLLLSAPLHHHLEAIGWPATKIVMRYWVISVIFAFLGVIVSLIG